MLPILADVASRAYSIFFSDVSPSRGIGSRWSQCLPINRHLTRKLFIKESGMGKFSLALTAVPFDFTRECSNVINFLDDIGESALNRHRAFLFSNPI